MDRLDKLLKPGGNTSKATVPTTSNIDEEHPSQQVCPVCGGIGWISYDAPVGHPNFGKAFRCTCQLADLESRQLDRLRRLSNMHHLERMTFDTFVPNGYGLNSEQRKSLKLAFDRAFEFARKPQGWLLLRGNYGCGKTHLAAAIANECLSRRQPVLFINVPDLLDHLRATYGPNSEVSFDERFDEVRDAPVLILDDLGTQNATPWAQEKLYQIFNHRYNAQLPTVITTNQDLEDIDPRLRSRLLHVEFVNQVKIMAPDFRGMGAGQARPELSSLGDHHDQAFDSFDLREGELPADQSNELAQVLAIAQQYAADVYASKTGKYPIGYSRGIEEDPSYRPTDSTPKPPNWLVFTGDYGCGKTHLAAAIANELAGWGYPVVFVVVPDLLDHLRAAFAPQSAVSYDKQFDDVRKADFLVLDDLGTESATPCAREKLYQLINHRYAARLPTVITTALKPKQLDPKVATRIADPAHCITLPISAPSYRGGKRRDAASKRKLPAPRRVK